MKPACPRCRTGKHVRPVRGDLFECTRCHAVFDEDPDEGGDYSDKNPSARLERQERQMKRQRKRGDR